MEVGKYTYGQNYINVLWEEGAKLKIGKFCSIADNITVFLGSSHRVDWVTTYPFGYLHTDIFNTKLENPTTIPLKKNRDVIIGNDVWIGSNVTIMSGVKIGDGAVIGRNSHIVENVKPYSVVGGNPAQFYYFRFSQDVINKLLELKWWDLDDSIINEILPLLCSNNFNKLFDYYEKKIKNKNG
jgi:acetyltransferase-like isoleucine patch superfamily enzyme